MLGRFDRYLLPFRSPLFSFFRAKVDNRAFGNQGRDFRGPDLHRLLDYQIHIFSFRNRLCERDSATQRRRFGFVQFPKPNFISRKIDNFRGDLTTTAIEENGAFTAPHSQDIASVMGFGAAQGQRARVPVFR